ncbi:hypothetical protein INS49_015181 [Diaporthe citri]|uniref:uncharacterized protein n=1 Tax=Diaporthe citri TaxID=83186 RepID=UPI001C7EBFD5|nr:uncharacterized protein INS49_015181 [Diaporthe citri]KAG6357303.1 hypothetical protein INS49_015181 [Diaporthe citri]
MSGNASSSVSTSHPTSGTLTTKKNTHTQSSLPPTAPTGSTLTATAIPPSTTEAQPSSSTPISPTYSFPTVPSSPLPSSSSITSTAPSDAADAGLNKAIIAGAVIGGVAVLSVVGFGIWFLKKIKKQPEDDDISMVGMPREEDVPMGMRNGIRRVRGNND